MTFIEGHCSGQILEPLSENYYKPVRLGLGEKNHTKSIKRKINFRQIRTFRTSWPMTSYYISIGWILTETESKSRWLIVSELDYMFKNSHWVMKVRNKYVIANKKDLKSDTKTKKLPTEIMYSSHTLSMANIVRKCSWVGRLPSVLQFT